MAHIFMVEDDLSLIKGLSFSLEKEGHTVTLGKTYREALLKWEEDHYDLVILDVSLPDGSGYDICRHIRQFSNVPIIFLTAADEEVDITMGLDIGGDDYITKPFKLSVFLSRINALLRRSQHFSEQSGILTSNGIVMDKLKGEVTKEGQRIDLTLSEYKMLAYFMEHPNQVLTSEGILAQLWDYHEQFVDPNTLSVYVRRLRKKIEDNPSEPKLIRTVRGMGYKWVEEK